MPSGTQQEAPIFREAGAVLQVASTRRRVVTCQGTIQLVTALAAREFHRRANPVPHAPRTFDDYLVIYDLCAPAGQHQEFAAFIERMTRHLGERRRITYIQPELLDRLRNRRVWGQPERVFGEIYRAVGTEEADEIYLCRNSQIGNQLLMHAFAGAHKICYGDAIGVYFTEIYHQPANKAAAGASVPLVQRVRKLLAYQWSRVQYKALHAGRTSTCVPPLPFDMGCFLLPRAFGEEPPMPVRTLEREDLLDIFERLNGIVPEGLLRDLQREVRDEPVSVLLPSNFSELGRMTEEAELAAYEEFLAVRQVGGTLIVKPHPRDGREKLEKLRQRLGRLFRRVMVLTDPAFFYVPFEVVYAGLFGSGRLPPPRVFAFSTACLSLEAVFGVPCEVGFGADLVRQYFREEVKDARLKHETDLEAILGRIRRGEG